MELGLSQEIEVFGQRGVRKASASAGLTRANALVSNTRRLAIADVDRTFYRLVFQKQRTLLAESVLDLNSRVSSIAERQLAAGEISRLDYNLAIVEVGRSRSRALIARRERDEIALDFGLLLGVAPGTVVDPVLDPSQHSPTTEAESIPGEDARALVEAAQRLKSDSLVALALSRRADLAASAALIEQTRAEATLAHREAIPNLIARAVAEPNAAGSGQTLRAGFGLTLPFFNRNKGEIAARRATLRQAEIQHAGLQARVRTEVGQAIAAYRAAAAEVEVLETTVLPPARQNRRLLESAYREGKVGLPVLLLIRTQVTDAELDYWSAWLAEREALATLAEITGQNLSGLPEPRIVQ
jgi:cobalt-zinc-cadmium efflux system outer membrane protein